MLNDEFEFLITQYLDGELSGDEKAAVEERLANDAEARAVFDQYKKLDIAIKRSMPAPAIEWDKLSEHLSVLVEEQDAAASRRIGVWLGIGVKLAVAAGIMLAIALWARMASVPQTPIAENPTPQTPSAVAVVTGPTIGAAAGPSVTEVSIGPPSLAQNPSRPADTYVFESLISGPTQIRVFASDTESGQDSLLPIR